MLIGDRFKIILEIYSQIYPTKEETISEALKVAEIVMPSAVSEQAGYMWDRETDKARMAP